MKHEDKLRLIINEPGLVSRSHKIVAGSITALFWVLWVYLCLPLMTLLAWVAGIELAYSEFQVKNQMSDLAELSAVYLTVVLALGTALLGWAATEYFRFRNVRRRVEPAPVTTAELAAHVQMSADELATLQQAKRLVVHHDGLAQFESADVLRAAA